MEPSLSVLIAEDNSADALLIQRALSECGLRHPPHIVSDGVEAVAYVSGTGVYSDRVTYPFPNLLILDLKMPKMSGFDVLEWFNDHAEFRIIPTVILSASTDPRDIKHAYCAGANGYLCKPTSFQEFKSMLARLLAHWDDCLKPSPEPGAPSCQELTHRQPFSAVHTR